MKGFFKFTTAALALVAMASCSNDDILTNGQAADAQAEGALQVEMEQLIDGVTTRAAYVPNGAANQLYWEKGDQIWVFDGALLKYDKYEFSDKRGTFENNGADNVKTPEFAFTTDPKAQLTKQKWFSDLNQVVVTYTLSSVPKAGLNDKIASTKGNKVRAYQFALPMWGEATKDDAGVKVSMKYLTSVLRVELGQLPVDKPKVRITAWADQAMTTTAPITGEFKAVLSEDDEIIEDAQLVKPTNEDGVRLGGVLVTSNTMTLDFDEMDSEMWNQVRANGGFVYIPLISQYYGALKFEYSVDGGTNWVFFKKTKPFTAKRATVYRMNIEELEIAGSDAESVNALLVKQKDTEGDVVVNTTYPTELSSGKNVILIPAGMKASSLTLNLAGIDGKSSWPFEIESEDGKFEGDVILDLGDGAVTNLPAIYLNLPKSNVVIKGDYKTANLGVKTSTVQDKLIVNSLTIAPITEDESDRGFTATNVGSIWPNYESFKGGAEPGIYVQENTTVFGDIDLSKPNENSDGAIGNTSIKIEGNVLPGSESGYVYAYVIDPAYKSSLIHKKKFYSDIPVTVGKKAVVTKIMTPSDITISDEATITGKAESTDGKITYTSSGKSTTGTLKASCKEKGLENSGIVTMTNGEIATVIAIVKAALSGEAKAANVDAAEVALSDQASVTTAVGATTAATTFSCVGTAWAQNATVDAKGTATINVTAEGEAIKGTLTLKDEATLTLTQGYIATIAGGTAKAAKLTFGASEGFTAIGTVTTGTKLEATNASTWNGSKIDATKTDFAKYINNGKVWTACMLATNDFSAATTLYSDIDLNNQAWTPVALQNNFSGNEKTIKNLAVTGADDKGTGFFTTVEASSTIQKLTIDGAAISAGGKTNVGVIAGIANAAVTISNVAIKNATVTGKYKVGGLFGTTADGKAIDITKADVAGIAFANPDAKKTEPALSAEPDKLAGSFGRYVGFVGGSFTADNDAAGTLDMKDLGFWAKLKKDSGKGYFYYPGTINCGLFTVSAGNYQVGSTTIPSSKIFNYESTTPGLYASKADFVTAGVLGGYVEASEWIK